MTRNEQALPEQALKACPFCGGDAEMSGADGSRSWWADCLNERCLAEGPGCFTEAEAIAAWNRRPAVSAEAGERIARLLPVEDGRFCMTISEGGDVTDIYEGPLIAVIRWALNLGLEMHLPALSQPASGGVAREKVLREALLQIEFRSTNHGAWFEQDPFGEYSKLGDIARAALAAPGQDEGVGL